MRYEDTSKKELLKEEKFLMTLKDVIPKRFEGAEFDLLKYDI